MNPKVSIIIPFYNCAYVDQAIQSAINQTYSNIEIIVVDDGSTVFIEKIHPFSRKIRYLRKENGGTATAINTGIQAATGEYIAWLSSDDYFLPEKVSKQIAFMLANNVEVSFTNYDYIDENNRILIPCYGKRFSKLKEVYESFLHLNAVNGCTVILNKDIFNKVGYFNPKFRYTHDYEMWFRLLVTGHKMHYFDEVLTKFRTHKEAGTIKYQQEMLNEITYVESYYRPLLAKYIKKL